MYRNIKQEKIVGDPGEPLLLTSFIQENRIDEALAAAQVDSELFLGVKSYAGYFTVREQYNANLFFWFFPSESDYENDPVVLWLQGGPGATSLFGLFEEHGPFSVDDNMVLQLREYSWSKSHSVIYIDNPVGTGYSFADSDGLAKDETQVGADLYEALIQFFTLFPELQKNEFYITGESYAGKYVPAIGYTILQQNPSASLQINLQGLAIGNGFSDPANQINYGDYLFQLGFVDSNTQQKLKDNEKEVQELVSQGEYIKANVVLDLNQPNNIFYTATGYYNYYNFLYPVDPVSDVGMDQFVQTEEARLAMHVGSTVLNSGNVYGNLEADVMQSVTPGSPSCSATTE
ncbi:hypothetical protein NQ318_010636 [Aromia moschata]|uniref:Carboxypeptidase n=1 Tax=Aromia moschata TaxID=1265417 RepID=A0AAV8X9M5_9CUCU|nr:hypothetical protein NQ318_010636 [Aromia moschata]